MEFQPDWKSKLGVMLLGKRRLLTLLDTMQLLQDEDFKQNQIQYKKISQKITKTCWGFGFFVVAGLILSEIATKRKYPLISVQTMAVQSCILFVGCVLSGNVLGWWVRTQANSNKLTYYKRYDPSFMQHFNVLCAKYEIDEDLQLEGILSEEEKKSWIKGYLQLQAAERRQQLL